MKFTGQDTYPPSDLPVIVRSYLFRNATLQYDDRAPGVLQTPPANLDVSHERSLPDRSRSNFDVQPANAPRFSFRLATDRYQPKSNAKRMRLVHPPRDSVGMAFPTT